MSQTRHLLAPRPLPGLLSLVIPIYNEEEVLPLLLERLRRLMADLKCPVEVLAVNDGSVDRSIELLVEAARQDARLKVISLARNFGHQMASTAGLDLAQGDAVVLMDADLQDPPELIHDMLREYQRGYDVVYAQRVERQGESRFKHLTAWLFYRLMRQLVHKDLPVDVGDFRLVSRGCLNALKSMRETHRFLRGMVAWVGFPQTAIPFVRPSRAAGQTKYSLRKMLLFAWNAAVSFSPLPLRLCFSLGVLLAFAALGYGAFALAAILFGLDVVRGWASTIAFTALVGGAVLIGLGVLGEYIGRIFEEVKGRPLYIVVRTVNMDHSRSDPAGQAGRRQEP